MYTVLSKSKEELGTDLAVFRSFTHQILPTFVAAEKKADEFLDVDMLLVEYQKIAAAKIVPEESSTHGSSAPIDADLLGLNDVQAPNQTEMALRKELVDVVETKDKILAEYTLQGTTKPIGISEYKLLEELPRKIKSALPSIEELEKELSKDIKKIKEDGENE